MQHICGNKLKASCKSTAAPDDKFLQLQHMDMAAECTQHTTTWRQEMARRFSSYSLPLPLDTSMRHLACSMDYSIILISICIAHSVKI
jgi:hypothetical protein